MPRPRPCGSSSVAVDNPFGFPNDSDSDVELDRSLVIDRLTSALAKPCSPEFTRVGILGSKLYLVS
jgi:hypothetical protein